MRPSARLSVVPLLLLLTLCSACEPPVHQTEPPAAASEATPILRIQSETLAAQQLTAFINAIRTGERAAVETLIREHMAGFLQEIPMDEHVEELMGFHEGFSQIVFHDLTRNEPHNAVGLFHNTQTGGWVKIGVEIEKSPPHRILTIVLEPATAPTP